MSYYQQKTKPSPSIGRLLKTIEAPPPHKNWDDFLDFSRMSMPEDIWTFSCRLDRNIYHRFTGNYMIIWFVVMITTGLLYDHWHLLSVSILCTIWSLICITTANPDYFAKVKTAHTPKYTASRDERVSKVPPLRKR